MAKILYYDIETAPNLSYVWGHFEQNVIEHEREWYLLCVSYRWEHENKTQVCALVDFPDTYAKDPENDVHVAKKLWDLLDEADIVIAHNGDRFDMRKANARFVYHNLGPVSPVKQIDTLKSARRYFMFNRFKAKQMCAKAVLEINDYELVNEREIREIIHRYRWLYKVVPYTPVDGPLGEFHKLYGALLKLSLYLNEKPNALIGTKEYTKIKNRSDKVVIEWLLKHEQLGKFLTKMYIDTFIADPEILNKGHDKLFAEFTLQVAVVDFYPLLDFIDIFTSHYSKVLEKYHNPEGDGIHYENDVEYYEAKETTLIDFIAPALKMPIEEVFKNHKEPFEVKRLKHLVPYKAYQRTSPSHQLQKAHDLFHQDQYIEAVELYQELLLTRTDLEEAKAGLAISYFILENYEMAEATVAQLNPYPYKDLIPFEPERHQLVPHPGY